MGFEAAPAFQSCDDGVRQRLISELPAWSGWCHRTSLADLTSAQPSAASTLFQRSNATWRRGGQIPIYRLLAAPMARRQRGRTHYVGLSFATSGSVQQRLQRHMNAGNRDAASRGLRAFVDRAGGAAHVIVELGTAQTRSPRLAHAVEILVQRAEKVLEWRRINRTTTFDDFESAVARTLVDLRGRFA
jgi:hypothetical protein